MSNDKGSRAKPSRGGEQFSDPLSWTPDMKAPPPPSSRPIAYGDEKREKDIANKILQEYGHSPLEFFKPVVAALFVGLVVFSQMDRSNMPNALAYSGLGMLLAVGVYVFVWKDTLPPFLSLIARGLFFLVILAGIGWHIAMRTDVLEKPPDKDTRQYRSATDVQ